MLPTVVSVRATLASTHVGGARACHSAPFHARLPRAPSRVPPAPRQQCRSVGVDSGREELHEVTVAGRPELETPEPDHHSRREWVGYARREPV